MNGKPARDDPVLRAGTGKRKEGRKRVAQANKPEREVLVVAKERE